MLATQFGKNSSVSLIPVAGMPVAGTPVAGMPVAGMPVGPTTAILFSFTENLSLYKLLQARQLTYSCRKKLPFMPSDPKILPCGLNFIAAMLTRPLSVSCEAHE